MNRSRNQGSLGTSGRGLIRNGLSVQELKAITAIRVGVAQEIDDAPEVTPPSNIVNSYETATPQQLAVAGLVLRSSSALSSLPQQQLPFGRQAGNSQFSQSTSDVSRKPISSSQRVTYNNAARLNDSYPTTQYSSSQQTRLLSGTEVVSSSLSVNDIKEMTRQRLSAFPGDDNFSDDGLNFGMRQMQQPYPSPNPSYTPPQSSLSFNGQSIVADPSSYQTASVYAPPRSQGTLAGSTSSYATAPQQQLNVNAQQFHSRMENNVNSNVMLGTALDREESTYYSQLYSSNTENSSQGLNPQDIYGNGATPALPSGLTLMSGGYFSRGSGNHIDSYDQTNQEGGRRPNYSGLTNNYADSNGWYNGNTAGAQYPYNDSEAEWYGNQGYLASSDNSFNVQQQPQQQQQLGEFQERNDVYLPRLPSPRFGAAGGNPSSGNTQIGTRATVRKQGVTNKNFANGEYDSGVFSMGPAHDANSFDYSYSKYQNPVSQEYAVDKQFSMSPPMRYRTHSDSTNLAYEVKILMYGFNSTKDCIR